jgi:hypothetical protein
MLYRYLKVTDNSGNVSTKTAIVTAKTPTQTQYNCRKHLTNVISSLHSSREFIVNRIHIKTDGTLLRLVILTFSLQWSKSI